MQLDFYLSTVMLRIALFVQETLGKRFVARDMRDIFDLHIAFEANGETNSNKVNEHQKTVSSINNYGAVILYLGQYKSTVLFHFSLGLE